MRIALVVERFEPAGGGVEGVVWNVARGLRDAGDEVHVIARRATDERGVRVHRIQVPSFWQPLRVSAFSRRVPPLVRRAGFDVVHSFSRTRRQDVFSANGGSHADYMRNVYSPLGARLRLASPRHALALRIEGQVFGDPTQTIQCVSRMSSAIRNTFLST